MTRLPDIKRLGDTISRSGVYGYTADQMREYATAAIKEALAQPEVCKANQQCLSGLPCVCQPERPWVSLTKEEIDSALCKYASWYNFAAHLENILKEKNK